MDSQGHRTLEAQGPQVDQKHDNKIGGAFKLESSPKFRQDRQTIFNEIKKQQLEIIAKAEKHEITITLKDGKVKKGQSFLTTPFEIAKGISQNLADQVLVARVTYSKRYDLGFEKNLVCADGDQEHDHGEEVKVDGEPAILWDLDRPLEGDCTLELLDFEDPKGRETFWHSSAHLLGASLEEVYGSHLCFGPPLDHGFFYDSYMGEHKVLPEDYKKIEGAAEQLVESKVPFERLVVPKEVALQMFEFNPFKVSFISAKVPEGGSTSVYKCGKLIDLCTGPHVPNSNRVKAFKVTQNSAAYWLGKNTNDDLQRVYAVSFPTKKQLDEYVKQQQELAKRDHRNVGKKSRIIQIPRVLTRSLLFLPPRRTYLQHPYQHAQKTIPHQRL